MSTEKVAIVPNSTGRQKSFLWFFFLSDALATIRFRALRGAVGVPSFVTGAKIGLVDDALQAGLAASRPHARSHLRSVVIADPQSTHEKRLTTWYPLPRQ